METYEKCSFFHLNCKCLRSTYFSAIQSYINYANVAWASTFKTELKKLFGKQKQSAGIIFNQNRLAHGRPLLKTLNVLNVYKVNLLQVLMFMHNTS